MIYLKVAHVEDFDSDYFSFSSLETAVNYIYDESIVDYQLSDNLFEEITENDYTYIESTIGD